MNAGLAPTACAMVLAGATALAVATGIWYVSLNAFMNYFNNWVLSPEPKGLGFSMPIFYSTWHMVASSIGCAIILRLRGLPPPSLEELKSCWKGVLPLALCTSVNIACNNASLALVSLFVNQVIKGTTPLITVPASMVLEKKRYPWYVIASVVVLVGGAVLSLDWSGGGDTPNQLLGIMLIVIAAFATAIKPVCAAVMMSGESKMSPVRLVFYDTLLSLPIMIAATLIFPGETARAVTYLRAKPGTAAFVICLGSLAAFSYNLSICAPPAPRPARRRALRVAPSDRRAAAPPRRRLLHQDGVGAHARGGRPGVQNRADGVGRDRRARDQPAAVDGRRRRLPRRHRLLVLAAVDEAEAGGDRRRRAGRRRRAEGDDAAERSEEVSRGERSFWQKGSHTKRALHPTHGSSERGCSSEVGYPSTMVLSRRRRRNWECGASWSCWRAFPRGCAPCKLRDARQKIANNLRISHTFTGKLG